MVNADAFPVGPDLSQILHKMVVFLVNQEHSLLIMDFVRHVLQANIALIMVQFNVVPVGVAMKLY